VCLCVIGDLGEEEIPAGKEAKVEEPLEDGELPAEWSGDEKNLVEKSSEESSVKPAPPEDDSETETEEEPEGKLLQRPFCVASAMITAATKEGWGLNHFMDGFSRYFFYLVGPDLGRWGKLIETFRLIINYPKAREATDLWRALFRWVSSFAEDSPPSYDFAKPHGDDNNWIDEAVGLFERERWYARRAPSVAWWVPEETKERKYLISVMEMAAAGKAACRSRMGAEWIISMGGLLPREYHTESTWTRIVAAARMMNHCDTNKVINSFCIWIANLVEHRCTERIWEGKLEFLKARAQWRFLENVVIEGDSMRRHELEWLHDAGGVRVRIVADAPIYMMEGKESGSLPGITVAVRNRAGSWKETSAIIDTGGVYSLVGAGCAGMIKESDCTQLEEPITIRSLTGERTRLHLRWAATLRLGTADSYVETKVSLLVCPKFSGSILLGQDELKTLNTIIDMEGDKLLVHFKKPRSKCQVVKGKTTWIPLQGKELPARR